MWRVVCQERAYFLLFYMVIVKKVIGVDLAGLLGGRMASAEGGSVSSGVAYGEWCPLSSRLRGLGERRELPQRSPGRRTDFGVF